MESTKREFVFHKRIFLKDTNVEGNVYFAHFFEWQGEAREEFFRENVPDHMQILKSGTKLITVNAWVTFKQSVYLFDEVLINVKTTNLKQMTLELFFTFVNKITGEIVAYGGQKLAFSDLSGSSISIPDSIKENAKYFLIDAQPEAVAIRETMRYAKIS